MYGSGNIYVIDLYVTLCNIRWRWMGAGWEFRARCCRLLHEWRLTDVGGTATWQRDTVSISCFAEARDKDVNSDRREFPWSPENVGRVLRSANAGSLGYFEKKKKMSTKVPKFGGTNSWEQYRQVFDDIVLSNGWDDATTALQLLSHLEGDALNVALLVPAPWRASQVGLVDALTAHYGGQIIGDNLRKPPERLGRTRQSLR